MLETPAIVMLCDAVHNLDSFSHFSLAEFLCDLPSPLKTQKGKEFAGGAEGGGIGKRGKRQATEKVGQDGISDT